MSRSESADPPDHPLAEVFGFPTDNFSERAERFRDNKLCPYNNKEPSCTKDKIKDPLGTCTIWDGDDLAITCPIRFREDWLVTQDAAEFIVDTEHSWTALSEVRLKDGEGKSAGNLDFVIVSYDKHGNVIDFGGLEVQSVYISGNVRNPFEHYMKEPESRHDFDWTGESSYPRADYLSSSRKRLVPQLLYKGAILKEWGKKNCVAMHKNFYDTLPNLKRVDSATAEVAWLIYDLEYDLESNQFHLVHLDTIYTKFRSSINDISRPEPSDMEKFQSKLQRKIDQSTNEELTEQDPEASLEDLINE